MAVIIPEYFNLKKNPNKKYNDFIEKNGICSSKTYVRIKNVLKENGGGLVLVEKNKNKVYSLPLEIAGLMSNIDPLDLVVKSQALFDKAYEMGVTKDKEAFFSLMFLSLAVIPHIRLGDKGLVDVFKFSFIPLDADE